MTNEEAVRILRRIQEPEAWEPQINRAAFEALDMAIEALGTNLAETGTNAISRQKAIDALTEYGNGRAVYIGVEEAVRRIEQLPPAEPHWIPCSERLPEESNIYIVTVDKDYISPNCDSVDTLWWEAKSQEWQYENRNAFVKFPAPVLAWMPLPEGWEEKKNA